MFSTYVGDDIGLLLTSLPMGGWVWEKIVMTSLQVIASSVDSNMYSIISCHFYLCDLSALMRWPLMQVL